MQDVRSWSQIESVLSSPWFLYTGRLKPQIAISFKSDVSYSAEEFPRRQR